MLMPLPINDNPSDRVTFTNYISSYAWYQLLTGDFAGAEKTLERGKKLDANNAYLFQGKYEAAEAAYKEWASKPFPPDDRFPNYAATFLDDFSALEEAGLIPEAH